MERSMKLACVVLVMCMVVIALMAEAAISCKTVNDDFAPCLPFLTGGPGPSPPCCGRVKKLLGAATTTVDLQDTCKCLKSKADSINGFKGDNANALPRKCGVQISFKISASTNCNTIKF